MMLAHAAGVPVEEWLVPLVAYAGGALVAMRAARAAVLRRTRERKSS
ncbi:MAG TPA: hypothetical protein VNC41_03720 [Acidimicrobiia bacterium]|nr:hypothetical protein [Acidimicrobiia bacterium]